MRDQSLPEIPPTKLVDLFISCLQRSAINPFRKSHQRSWWICSYPAYNEARSIPSGNPTNEVGGFVHILPTTKRDQSLPEIPPTKLVDLFISCLQRSAINPFRKSHQRSWWIVHILPTPKRDQSLPEIPPTKLVD